jgi:hypothetical protein
MSEAVPVVFISYSHDSPGHRDKVLAFADRLRADGIDAQLDQYTQFPPEGWNAHCARQIRRVDRVLIVSTEIYRRRWDGEEEPGRGNGVRSEANLIRNYFYEEGSEGSKFVPILFAGAIEAHIPGELRGLGRYRADTPDGFEQLYRLLTGQHDTPAPPIGQIRTLELRPRPEFGSTAAALPAPLTPDRAEVPRRARADRRSEPDPRAQNYERVDMVSSEPEVLVDSLRDGRERGVFVQVDFIDRLYIEGNRGRIEFGVQRAFVTVDNDGPGSLSRSDFVRMATTRRNARFVNLHDAPGAVSVCMDPDPGKTSLAELALPPTPRENYLCQIASATAAVDSACMRAELHVSLDVEGLFLADEVGSKISASMKKQIEAIVAVAATKNHHQIDKGVIRRKLPVRDRER